MADLYHLLDELDENEAADAAAATAAVSTTKDSSRRLTVETAVTEMLSEDEDDHDIDGNDALDNARPEIPETLQKAAKEQDEYYYKNYNKGGNTNKNGDFDDGTISDKFNEKVGNGYIDNEEEELVPNELYTKLNSLWLQERHCPELLDYDEEMVEELVRTFEEREEEIDEMADSHDPVELLLSSLQQQDMDRAKFVLSDWLTQRLEKIEAHPLHMRTKIDSMSASEVEYLQAYGMLMEHHLNATVLNHNGILEAWRGLDDPEMIDKPDFEGYHFWFLKQSILDEEEGVQHDAGTVLIASYIDMKDDMKQNKVELLT